LLWLAFGLRLIIAVDSSHLHLRMFPLVNKHIPLEAIARFETVNHHPLRDFGGWGVR